LNDSHNVDGIQTIGRSSHKMIEAVMQSSSKGKVTHFARLEILSSCMHAGPIALRRGFII
jgi:hypothetical protein